MKKYALITPSFKPDFERCRLLCESVDRFVDPTVQHYIIVDRRDYQLFKTLRNRRTSLICVEDIIPYWIFRIPLINKLWLSLKTLPLRNWILQQLVKLTAPAILTEENFLYTDSDVFFVRPYLPKSMEQNGAIPLFMETGQRGLIQKNDLWHASAATLLGCSTDPSYDTNFIDNVIPWRRANVILLQEHLSNRYACDWQQVIARQLSLSEYVLYGLFCTRILGEQSLHFPDPVKRSHSYWESVPMGATALLKFKNDLGPEHTSVMISAKSHTDVSLIRQAFL